MKTFIISIIILITGTLSAQVKTDTFAVNGNCNMCKERIEKAADIKGVSFANWDVKTNKLTVKYNSEKVSIDDIQKSIANAGHDTPAHKADNKVYEKLHHCCQYDRLIEN
jgi:copper chaperone CopZ